MLARSRGAVTSRGRSRGLTRLPAEGQLRPAAAKASDKRPSRATNPAREPGDRRIARMQGPSLTDCRVENLLAYRTEVLRDSPR
jgi:hypothetical protein